MLTGKPTGKRPLGRPGRRWKNDIRMGFSRLRIGIIGRLL